MDPGRKEFEATHVSLREYEVHPIRAIVRMLVQTGPISAAHRGDGVPGERFVIAVNRHGVPGTLFVFQGSRLDQTDGDPPATGAEGAKLFHGQLLPSGCKE